MLDCLAAEAFAQLLVVPGGNGDTQLYSDEVGWKWGQAPIVVIGASPHFPQYPRQDSNLEPSALEADAKISENQIGATTYDDTQPPGCFAWRQGGPRILSLTSPGCVRPLPISPPGRATQAARFHASPRGSAHQNRLPSSRPEEGPHHTGRHVGPDARHRRVMGSHGGSFPAPRTRRHTAKVPPSAQPAEIGNSSGTQPGDHPARRAA